MSTHRLHNEIYEVYFCTVTCYKWLALFEESDGYETVYTWFDHLTKNGCLVLAYVIMPNHLHVLLYPANPLNKLNKLVGNGKRCMAYDIIKRLTHLNKIDLLNQMSNGVKSSEAKKGKKHEVFRLSFDARKCFNEKMLEQKLDYIHRNPVSGKWNLVKDFVNYKHSSASYYEEDRTGKYKVVHYKELDHLK
jgi:REP element-mobilizing transposase RayT